MNKNIYLEEEINKIGQDIIFPDLMDSYIYDSGLE